MENCCSKGIVCLETYVLLETWFVHKIEGPLLICQLIEGHVGSIQVDHVSEHVPDHIGLIVSLSFFASWPDSTQNIPLRLCRIHCARRPWGFCCPFRIRWETEGRGVGWRGKSAWELMKVWFSLWIPFSESFCNFTKSWRLGSSIKLSFAAP